MKKTTISLIIVLLLLVCGVGYFILSKGGKTTVMTLDVNPSLQLTLKKEKVIDIIALNNDGNDVITDNIIDSKINDALDIIVNNLIEKDYIKDNEVTIIVGLEGDDKSISDNVRNAFKNHEINANVVVPAITEEAKKAAEEHNVSPAKAAYINEVTKENTKVNFEDLTSKSADEIKTMRDTGNYCDLGYTLKGDTCEKKLREENPKTGYTCPSGYELVNDKCYKTKGTEDTLYCGTRQTLKDGKCEGEVTSTAKGKCETGEYNSKTSKCEVLTLVGDATKKCNEADDLLLSNGKCASHKPGAHSYGDNDEPFNETTECCCGDKFHTSPNPDNPGMGWCYNMSGDYNAKVTCPSGQTLKDGKCYSATSSDATYYCEGNGKLNGNKCTEVKTVAASKKKGCSDGYKLYEDRICVNYGETTERIEGYTCEKDARLENNHCVYYEVVEAKHN